MKSKKNKNQLCEISFCRSLTFLGRYLKMLFFLAIIVFLTCLISQIIHGYYVFFFKSNLFLDKGILKESMLTKLLHSSVIFIPVYIACIGLLISIIRRKYLFLEKITWNEDKIIFCKDDSTIIEHDNNAKLKFGKVGVYIIFDSKNIKYYLRKGAVKKILEQNLHNEYFNNSEIKKELFEWQSKFQFER
ncbi:hypothetical protein AAEX28_15120 [Lentisphaerota bacterium WC36G]|nr:hypothetical protein LJT99_01875 [Lentisphaerae bacterium WC36]